MELTSSTEEGNFKIPSPTKTALSQSGPINVRGTRLLADDTREHYREKIARITLDSMVQFVGLLDAQGTVLEINQVALDGVGIKLSEVEGKPFWTTFWWQVSEEINQTLRDSIVRAAQGEFVRWDTPIYGRASGKETIIIDASLMPVKDEHGQVVFITAEGRDITEKKAQEREIARKNIELQGLLERIRELDEIKTQFFANVSHELRTPLQLIIGPADRLGRDDGVMPAEQRQDSARVIARNARLLLKHVNDLLDISKLEAGKLKLDLLDLNLVSLVRLTASHFDVLAADRNINYVVEVQGELAIAVDSEKIQRVVMNLLSNAFKFVPNGGQVRVALRSSNKEITLSVEDSGPGVKPELRQAIFERFRQGDGGANRQFGGTGLGLAIAKEFVEMHHGNLGVTDSNLGGACFQLTLPLNRLSGSTVPASATERLDQTVVEGVIEELRPVTKRRAELSSKPSLASQRPTVLVVEDNPEMNQFIQETLASEYHVVAAFDGQEGLAQALKSHPALIVTDIMMPKVSGVEMITEIRKCLELADVPILLLTAKADEELKVKLLEGHAQDFIAKPFSEKDLFVRVKNLIELKKTQERHGTLFNSMDEGFCTIEVLFDENQKPLDYCFLEINGAFEKQTGVKNARGKRMREIAPDLEKSWFEIFGRIALTGESTRFENRAEALGRWFEVYAFRVGPAQNRQVAIFFSDITRRKEIQLALEKAREELGQANDTLSKSNEELERRVEKRTASLSEAIEQMEEFSYTVSHDLRAPLRGMQAYSETLLEDYSDLLASKPEAIEYLQRIAENASRLDKMVCDVLTFSRVSRGELKIVPVSTDKLVRGLVQSYPAMQSPHAEINIEPLSDVLAHEPSLSQAISNLLTNAIKFVPPHTTPKIRIWSERRAQDVRIWVEDNGIGIDPQFHNRLFNMFERIYPDSNYEGTGVGLAVVRKATERMNGKVGLESDGTKGSRFWIQLRATVK